LAGSDWQKGANRRLIVWFARMHGLFLATRKTSSGQQNTFWIKVDDHTIRRAAIGTFRTRNKPRADMRLVHA